MKNLILLFIVCAGNLLFGQQSGVITYVETVALKLDVEGENLGGVDISSMLPSERKEVMILSYQDQKSSYRRGEKQEMEDQSLSSDDGTIRIEIMEDDTESNYYVDYQTKQVSDLQGFMGKSFIIESDLEKPQWKVSPDKVKYLGYECLKATTKNKKGVEVTAWFAPEISIGVGPRGYGQLPGAILMLTTEDKTLEIKATEVSFKDEVSVIKPKEGKKVSAEEYEKIVDEKMKEMEENMKGNGMMIQIRG